MQCELKTITPEYASSLLVRNVGNRALSRSHVESLAKEMRAGRWKVNGDTICVNGSRLIDGQHRLQAVVESGVTIQSLVVTDLPSDVFDTKDVGKRRSPGDTLSVLGVPNAARLAAALALVDAYCTGRGDVRVHYTNTEVEGLMHKYPDVMASIQSTVNGKSLLQPSVLDACHYLFSQKDKGLADEFVVKVLKGTGLTEGSAWYVLRERLVANSLSKAKLSRPYLMALCIKAWNCERSGKTVRCLRWREKGDAVEPYPVIH
jgi:hypothetical protein